MIEVGEEEKERLIKKLSEKYKSDFSFLNDFILFKNSDNKYFIFSGKYILNGERIGLEAFKEERGKVRLYFQFANLFKEKVNDFFFDIGEKEAKDFLMGKDLEFRTIFEKNKKNKISIVDKEFYLLRYEENFLGNVKLIERENLLKNYLGKQYRFKNIEL